MFWRWSQLSAIEYSRLRSDVGMAKTCAGLACFFGVWNLKACFFRASVYVPKYFYFPSLCPTMSASKWTDPHFTRFRLQSKETKLARAQENIQRAKAEAERTRLELIAEAERLGQEKMTAILEQEKQLEEEIEKENKAEEQAAQRRIDAEEAKKKAEAKRKSNAKGKKAINDQRKAEEIKLKETSTENQIIHVRGKACVTDAQNNDVENEQGSIWEDLDEQLVQGR